MPAFNFENSRTCEILDSAKARQKRENPGETDLPPSIEAQAMALVLVQIQIQRSVPDPQLARKINLDIVRTIALFAGETLLKPEFRTTLHAMESALWQDMQDLDSPWGPL